ncbi:MAG TPA: RNA polymerase factor sigma-70 [Accumulibacter sp.]|uniref:RNA polymerase factor sigma-70 n=1 Tax=Accumulibacter sp. TaxID=2053492 RepID=UPI000EC7D7A5|nr:RNA polymerase factor sigma-70 [Accumulibacter sp.]HCZ14740.1 RNA polymerase subunit sigma [Accumulibacter sp.]HRF73327.1 RNA polymerase factor sigma-70 [Accumulibacter sp.]
MPEVVRSAASESSSLLADTGFLESLRRQMLKFATLQLSDANLAEDAVQEALIGALRNARTFAGRAALKTWVFAILKNKIADILRQKQRTIDASSLLREDEEEEDFSSLFNQKGFWQADQRPGAWPHPEEALREGEFWLVFETCLENLPGNQARVFMMREFVELDSQEICETVGLSISNLHVMLHRARLRLRECLEDRWFLAGEQPC